jgi:hypothetical protein
MKKIITVNDLLAQLTAMKEQGFGDYKLAYMDENSIAYALEIGVHDYYENDKIVVLG